MSYVFLFHPWCPRAQSSKKENLKIFIGRLFKFKEIPARFTRQVYNLWTPNSFFIFRLLHADQKYDNFPYPHFMAYLSALMYILVIALGFIGICCVEEKSFRIFTAANLLFLSFTGTLFLLCSRFRIPFIYLFIIYTSVVLSNPKAVLKKITWPKAILLGIVLLIFADIIMSKHASFGYWG